ncbi:MAG: GNAT family N-acetyltransferase [Burkholderiales bacterium]
MSLRLAAPQPLEATHDLASFDCGEPSLNEWLKRRALASHLSGASRTFVVVDDQILVVGYYALAAGAISHESAAGAVRRNMPDPIPVLVLGRLAVDQRAQGIHLGAALLRDAVQRGAAVSQNAGVRAIVVHALNDRARDFYQHYGFQGSPLHPMTMMLRLG